LKLYKLYLLILNLIFILKFFVQPIFTLIYSNINYFIYNSILKWINFTKLIILKYILSKKNQTCTFYPDPQMLIFFPKQISCLHNTIYSACKLVWGSIHFIFFWSSSLVARISPFKGEEVGVSGFEPRSLYSTCKCPTNWARFTGQYEAQFINTSLWDQNKPNM
jgi:hypothetical protein